MIEAFDTLAKQYEAEIAEMRESMLLDEATIDGQTAIIEALVNALNLADATLQRIAPDGSRATQGTRDVIRAALDKAKG